MFKCVRCKKFKPRTEFNDNFTEFGNVGNLIRKPYCKDCELPRDGGHERKNFSCPIKIKKQKLVSSRICKNCGEEYFIKGFSKYCRLCRTPSGRKKRKIIINIK